MLDVNGTLAVVTALSELCNHSENVQSISMNPCTTFPTAD